MGQAAPGPFAWLRRLAPPLLPCLALAGLASLASPPGSWPGPQAALAQAPNQATLDLLWRQTFYRLGGLQRQATREAELRLLSTQMPGVLGTLNGRWVKGQLVMVDARTRQGHWVYFGDAAGKLLYQGETKEVAPKRFLDVQMLRGQGAWLWRSKAYENHLRNPVITLRYAKVAEVADAERRWTSLRQEMSRPRTAAPTAKPSGR